MSHSLHLPGCPIPLYQTRTDFTFRWVDKDRMEVLDAYRREYIDPMRPTPLRGKDARNPYKIAQHREVNEEFDRHYEDLREWLERHPQARWAND
jgi:hypothetical protein